MIRTRSAPLQTELTLRGTANFELDTANLTAMGLLASQTKQPLALTGTFVLTPGPLAIFNHNNSSATPVFSCVPFYSDLHIIGRGARIFFKSPAWVTAAARFLLFGPAGFGTSRGLFSNGSITGDIVFDFSPTYEPWAVTFDAANDTIIFPDGFTLAEDQRFTLDTTGVMLTPLAEGTSYYIIGSSIVGTAAQFSLTPSTGAHTPVALSGTQSGTHTASLVPSPFIYAVGLVGYDNFKREGIRHYAPANHRAGRGFYGLNCSNRRDCNLSHVSLRQAYYLGWDDGAVIEDIYMEDLDEGMDCDRPNTRMIGRGIVAKNFTVGDKQVLDFSGIDNSLFSDIRADNVATIVYMYSKFNGWATMAEAFANTGQTVTLDIANDTVTFPVGFTLTGDKRFALDTTGALPTGAADNTLYYIIGSTIVGTTAQFSTTPSTGAHTPVALSGTQSGVHTALLAPTVNAGGAKNVTISGVRGINLTGGANIARVSNLRNEAHWYLPDQIQCANVLLYDWKLEGGTGVIVNEGDNIKLIDIEHDGSEPASDVDTGFALVARQSTQAIGTAESRLSVHIERYTITNAKRGGVRVGSATKLVARDITVDGYNLLGDTASPFGFTIGGLGLKAGSDYHVSKTRVRGYVNNLTDFRMLEAATALEYGLSTPGPFNLGTTTSGSVNATFDLDQVASRAAIRDKIEVDIPTVNTTSSGALIKVIKHAADDYYVVLGASFANADAIVDTSPNTSKIVLSLSNAAGGGSIGNGVIFNNMAHDKDSEINMGIAHDAVNNLFSPGDSLRYTVQMATGAGNAATVPGLLKVALFTYRKTWAA